MSLQILMVFAHIHLCQFQKDFLDLCIPTKDQNHPGSRSLNGEGYAAGITRNSFFKDSLYEL